MSFLSRIGNLFKRVVSAVRAPFGRRHSAPSTPVKPVAPVAAPIAPVAAPTAPTPFEVYRQKIKSYGKGQLNEDAYNLANAPQLFKRALAKEEDYGGNLDTLIDSFLKVPQSYRILIDQGMDIQNDDGSVEHKYLMDQIYRAAGGSGVITWKVPMGLGVEPIIVSMPLTGDKEKDEATLFSFSVHEIYSLMADPRIDMKTEAEQTFNS